MDHPPPATTVLPSSSSSPPLPPSNASVTMVVITVVGILAAFAVLAGYYAFVTKCQPLRALLFWSSTSSNNRPPWQQRRARGGGGGLGQLMMREPTTVIRAAASEHRRGLGLPLIRMLPVVKFTAAEAGRDDDDAGRRISVSECAVCLSEFVERERVRLLPNCSHAFHIDCIDTWLQGSARCPFCRSDVTLPPSAVPLPVRCATASKTTTTTTAHYSRRRDADDHARDDDDSIVIEVRGEHETWLGHGGRSTTPAGRRHRRPQQERSKAESVGDEAIDTRKKDEAFAVQAPLRRSLSLDSSCDKHLYLSVQELLVTTQRQ